MKKTFPKAILPLISGAACKIIATALITKTVIVTFGASFLINLCSLL